MEMVEVARATPDLAAHAQMFHALSDERRLRILHALRGGELCVCDLQAELGMAQLAGAHKHMGRELQGDLGEPLPLIAINRPQQFANAAGIGNCPVMRHRGRGECSAKARVGSERRRAVATA